MVNNEFTILQTKTANLKHRSTPVKELICLQPKKATGRLRYQPALSKLVTRHFVSFNVESSHTTTHVFYTWIIAFLILLAVQILIDYTNLFNLSFLGAYLAQALIPVIACSLIILVAERNRLVKIIAPYILFFLISFSSVIGLTATLTGSYTYKHSLIFYGLSFYSATLAYHYSKQLIRTNYLLLITNPLLLITGPVMVWFSLNHHKAISTRFHFYFPYVVLGVFLHQTIAAPLTNTFFLISKTDLVSCFTFAFLFEIFVYANFCGLSLAIYGIMGIIGIRIPLNFRQPFSSTNIVDFWRGWHTSLSVALKALFYYPSRKLLGSSTAIYVVFLSSALWHGVTLNFVMWGFFHATLYAVSLILLRRRVAVLPVVLFLFGVVGGRLLFADANFERLLSKLMLHFNGYEVFGDLLSIPLTSQLACLLGIAFVVAEMIFQKHPLFRQRTYKFYRLPLTQLALVAITLLTVSNSGNDYAVYGQR